MWLPNGKVRKLRKSLSDPGVTHELTFSCYRSLPLLARDRTRQWFVNALDQARRKHDLELWAYVIMPEHVHVLFLPRRDTFEVASLLQAVKQPVARRAIAFLKEHNPKFLQKLSVPHPSGSHCFQFWQAGGGYDRNIIKVSTADKAVQYIHNNPVRRGLVDHPTDWIWSSARWYAGEVDVVLAMDATPDG